MLITECPAVSVAGLPRGVEARQAPDGEIIFWDGRRQYHTGAKAEGPALKRAKCHHFGAYRGRKSKLPVSGAVQPDD